MKSIQGKTIIWSDQHFGVKNNQRNRQQLCFDVTRDEPPLRLNDDDRYNYLNYNTNI